jgi:hypothetical protein
MFEIGILLNCKDMNRLMKRLVGETSCRLNVMAGKLPLKAKMCLQYAI